MMLAWPPGAKFLERLLEADRSVARFAELETLLCRYNDAVNDAIGFDQPHLDF
jgi:hypothetical protein